MKEMKGVVSAPELEAVEAGRQMLLKGGNSVDAAIATAFAQGVVDPQMTSLGGQGVAQIYHARSGENICIDFLGRAPLKANPDMWTRVVKRSLRFGMWELQDHANEIGHMAVACPGNLMGYWEVHRRFGQLPWKDMIQPAIDLAEKGFVVSEELARLWARPPTQEGRSSMWEVLTATPASTKLFTVGGRRTYQTGELFVNRDYAKTLKEVAEHGPDLFYRGWIAERIAEDFERNGGMLSLEDLKSYRVRIVPPLRSTYRDLNVTGTPPPTSCVQVMEILNILEGFDLSKLGPSADYFHIMALAQKASFVDRALYLADPEFQSVPVEKLLSKEHARSWQGKIRANELFQVPMDVPAEVPHTTTVSAIDEEGNAVALTHTLCSPASGVVVDGLGFMFNNVMQMFCPYPGYPNSIAPGKARTTGMSPTFLWKGGKPWIVLSAPGATKIATAVLQVLLNLIDHKMTPMEAVSAPRIHCEEEFVDVEARLFYTIREEMERRGHKLQGSVLSYDSFFALVHVALRDPETGILTGAGDPRWRGGLAIVGGSGSWKTEA